MMLQSEANASTQEKKKKKDKKKDSVKDPGSQGAMMMMQQQTQHTSQRQHDVYANSPNMTAQFEEQK